MTPRPSRHPNGQGPVPAPRTARSANGPTCQISDEGGAAVAEVVLLPGETPRSVAVRPLTAKGALLGFYFGKGRRRVRIGLGEFTLPAILHTRWAGRERVWWVELCAAAPEPGGARRAS